MADNIAERAVFHSKRAHAASGQTPNAPNSSEFIGSSGLPWSWFWAAGTSKDWNGMGCPSFDAASVSYSVATARSYMFGSFKKKINYHST